MPGEHRLGGQRGLGSLLFVSVPCLEGLGSVHGDKTEVCVCSIVPRRMS